MLSDFAAIGAADDRCAEMAAGDLCIFLKNGQSKEFFLEKNLILVCSVV